MKSFNSITKKINKNIDDPSITLQRKKIIQNKLYLKQVYIDYYQTIKSLLSKTNLEGKVVELGSGGGFIKKFIPRAITSDLMILPNVDMQISALNIPFKKTQLDAIVMINVLHHLPDAEKFFKEANRCLRENGQLIMIEPSNTLLGKIIYKYFHHEPYRPHAQWRFSSSGPLSGANSCLPWIIFYRDRTKFIKKFPKLKIEKIYTIQPLTYILSGGFTLPQLLPDFTFSTINKIEKIIHPLNQYLGIFYVISITKKR